MKKKALECPAELDIQCRENSFPIRLLPDLVSSAEVYGLGKAIRQYTKWPKFLPIPVSNDHGVPIHSNLEKHEIANVGRTHLVWSDWRVSQSKKKRTLRIPHPWVYYRRQKRLEPRADARGTLVFIEHSIRGMEYETYDWTHYFNQLSQLPKSFAPFVLCFHCADVARGLHDTLKPFGHTMVTLGNGRDPEFVDRFYDLLQGFQYATSTGYGSQAPLAEEVGVSYFLLGEPRTVVEGFENVFGAWKSSDFLRLGQVDEIFRKIPPGQDPRKGQWVERALGLDLITQRKVQLWLRIVMVIDFVLVWPRVFMKIFERLFGRTS